jgi:hypothetical protein
MEMMRYILFILILLLPSPAFCAWSVWAEQLIIDKPLPTYNPVTKPSSISISGAKGEWVAFYIIARVDESVSTFVPSITATFTDSSSRTIADSKLTFYMVQEIAITTSSWNGNTQGSWPDPCVPYVDRFYGETRSGTEQGWGKTITANNTQPFLVEIYIPEGTRSGVYNGTIRLTGQGSAELTGDISVALTVYNFTVPLSWSYGSLFSIAKDTDTVDLFGSRRLGHELMIRSLIDHGINGAVFADTYYSPGYTNNTAAVDFNDQYYNDPTYGGRRIVEGTIANSQYNPRPYFGVRPKIMGPSATVGNVLSMASLYLHPTDAEFSDNGSGLLRVKTYLTNYFQNGDVVGFYGSALYAGEYTVTTVSANEFDLNTAYIGNDAATWSTRVLNKTKIKKYYDDYDAYIASHQLTIDIVTKVVDEPTYPECEEYVSKAIDYIMLNGTTSRPYIYPGATVTGNVQCAPTEEGSDVLFAKTSHNTYIVSEMMGFIRPTQNYGGVTRTGLQARIDSYGDKPMVYTANTQAIDYNAYGQTSTRTLPSWYIDTITGGRENAATPLSMWIWDVVGYHYWLVNGAIAGCGLSDVGWADPACNDPYKKYNGDGALLYSGYATGSSNDIGGTHNIPIESLRMKLWRYGMYVLEYAKLLEAQGLSRVADDAINAMIIIPSTGTVWGTVPQWITARESMAARIAPDYPKIYSISGTRVN